MEKTSDKGGATITLCHSDTSKNRPQESSGGNIDDRVTTAIERLHITEIGDRFHVFEIPGADGSPLKWWGGPFGSELAAELFRNEVAEAYAWGDVQLRRFLDTDRGREHYDEWARIVAFIEDGNRCHAPGDHRSLARDLCINRPWETKTRQSEFQPQSNGRDDEIPF